MGTYSQLQRAAATLKDLQRPVLLMTDSNGTWLLQAWHQIMAMHVPVGICILMSSEQSEGLTVHVVR